MRKKVHIFDNPEDVINRFTIIKDDGDAFIINTSPFSYPKNAYGYYGNIIKNKNISMDDLMYKAKCDKRLFGKLVNDINILPDEVKQYIKKI